MRVAHRAAMGLMLLGGTPALAQTFQEMAADLAAADQVREWEDPAEPFRIVGPVSFVGTRGLGMFLIETSEGLILMNTGGPGSGPMIEASVRALGHDPEEIEILLAGHAHLDHVGGHAYIKELSGAQVMMLSTEAPLAASGGKLDFLYGDDPDAASDPVEVDRVLRDGDRVVLGDVALDVIATPGHTMGSATYAMDVMDQGRVYRVVFPDGTKINAGTHIEVDPSYPGIGDDYRETFHRLEMLHPDIWLPPHNPVAHFWDKHERAATQGVAAWVDPDGYRRFVRLRREAFEAQVEAELAIAAPAP